MEKRRASTAQQKSNWKAAVLLDAKNQHEKYKNSPARLHAAIPFSHSLTVLPESHHALVDLFNEILGKDRYKKDQKWQDFLILLSNLALAKRKPVSISLHRNDWEKNKFTKASYYAIRLVTSLHERGLIEMKKGYKGEKESRMTRIWATEKLLSYMPRLPNFVIDVPLELVVLRDREGKLMDYEDTRETNRIRGILQRVNAVNEKNLIEYGRDRLHPTLYAVFKEKFTWYGRLHTKGYRHYQGLCGEERAEITINGMPVVELDYSGLHPHLLYSKEGIQYDADPYSVVDQRPEVRPFLKQILLSQINAKDAVSAERAANKWLFDNREERRALSRIGITRARPLIEAFREVHKPVSKYFCNGRENGLRIMNLDSKIALEVVNHFAKKGVPILPVHDSFIVQEQYCGELKETMQTAYSKWTGGFTCPIKQA